MVQIGKTQDGEGSIYILASLALVARKGDEQGYQ